RVGDSPEHDLTVAARVRADLGHADLDPAGVPHLAHVAGPAHRPRPSRRSAVMPSTAITAAPSATPVATPPRPKERTSAAATAPARPPPARWGGGGSTTRGAAPGARYARLLFPPRPPPTETRRKGPGTAA